MPRPAKWEFEMKRTDAFERFVDPARSKPELWRVLVALVSGVFVYVVAGQIILSQVLPLLAWIPHPPNGQIVGSSFGQTPREVIALLLSFLGMVAGVLVMAAWHKRGLRSLLGDLEGFATRFCILAGVALGIALILGLVWWALGNRLYTQNLPFGFWIGIAAIALPLVFVQITAEELVFRGYLQQQLAARFRSPTIWMVLPSILFGLIHFQPSLDLNVALLLVLSTTVFGLVAADITRVTGSLAGAMGLHFANNVIALLLIGVPGQLSGLALFHTPFRIDDTAHIVPLVSTHLVYLGFAWVAARRIMR